MSSDLKSEIESVLSEVQEVLTSSDYSSSYEAVQLIREANKIVSLGAGRVGLSMSAFAKRLMHLGKQAWVYSDDTLPRMANGDLMVIASGSGETESIVCLAKIARRNGLQILLVTSNENSTLAKLATAKIVLNAPNKLFSEGRPTTIQPMTTLFEQCVGLFFDAFVLKLMNELSQTEEDMKMRHNSIE
jgi:6-phospho-3-hexuloisomerase